MLSVGHTRLPKKRVGVPAFDTRFLKKQVLRANTLSKKAGRGTRFVYPLCKKAGTPYQVKTRYKIISIPASLKSG